MSETIQKSLVLEFGNHCVLYRVSIIMLNIDVMYVFFCALQIDVMYAFLLSIHLFSKMQSVHHVTFNCKTTNLASVVKNKIIRSFKNKIQVQKSDCATNLQ